MLYCIGASRIAYVSWGWFYVAHPVYVGLIINSSWFWFLWFSEIFPLTQLVYTKSELLYCFSMLCNFMAGEICHALLGNESLERWKFTAEFSKWARCTVFNVESQTSKSNLSIAQERENSWRSHPLIHPFIALPCCQKKNWFAWTR